MNNKDKFKAFLRTAIAENGRTYKPNTQGTYFVQLNALNEAIKQKALFPSGVADIYDISDTAQFHQIIKLYESNSEIKDELKQKGHNFIGGVLKQYELFLESNFLPQDDGAGIIPINYDVINAEHIKNALEYVAEKGQPSEVPKSFVNFVVYNGNKYAPKYILACAYIFALNKDIKSANKLTEEFRTVKTIRKLKKFSEMLGYIVEGNEKELSDMTPQEREKLFITWLKAESKKQGAPKEATLVGYCSALKAIWAQIENPNKKKSPFDFFSDMEIAAITDPYIQKNKITGDPKQGIVYYIKFLKEYGENDATLQPLDEAMKFKNLLEWFVKQLNRNIELQGKKGDGSLYGYGYKGDRDICAAYKEYSNYDFFSIDVSLMAGLGSYDKKGHPLVRSNYINKKDTVINVYPVFSENKTHIIALELAIKSKNIWGSRKTVEELGLFSETLPNNELQLFFSDFKKLILVYDDETASLNGNLLEEENLKGENIILYGVPGSGKSFTIKREVAERLGVDIKDADAIEAKYAELCGGGQIVRVVFHPDYTYSDFTGQILPKAVDGKVNYQFTPGPFTRVLKAAVNNPQKPYFLVIEEINRGNAAAIFGDLFQLLDRTDYESEYPIDSIEISKSVHGIETDDAEIPKILIPKNLWLLATMNTSDQNVFTLDTAFQRRWDMRLIFNEFLKGKDDKINHDFIIEETDVTWRIFAETINRLLETGGGVTSEDKRLGAWFIRPDLDEGQTVSKKRFANKVLKYLWDDAFKFQRDKLFDTASYPTLEKVIGYFLYNLKSGQRFGNLFAGSLFAQISEEDARNG